MTTLLHLIRFHANILKSNDVLVFTVDVADPAPTPESLVRISLPDMYHANRELKGVICSTKDIQKHVKRAWQHYYKENYIGGDLPMQCYMSIAWRLLSQNTWEMKHLFPDVQPRLKEVYRG